MKLFLSANSPYARKVRVVIHEMNIGADIAFEEVDPRDSGSGLWQCNPLGKIPTLVTEDGRVILDSPVICEYLNEKAGGALLPAAADARWHVRTLVALADGIMDAGMSARLESSRPEGERSVTWVNKQMAAVARGLDILEEQAPQAESGLNLGSIAVACALDWLLYRHAAFDWLATRPKLTQWHRTICTRPSLEQTRPGQPVT